MTAACPPESTAPNLGAIMRERQMLRERAMLGVLYHLQKAAGCLGELMESGSPKPVHMVVTVRQFDAILNTMPKRPTPAFVDGLLRIDDITFEVKA